MIPKCKQEKQTDLNLETKISDISKKVDTILKFSMVGQLGNPLWWRIGKLNKYFGSLITLNIFCDNGYVETIHLNIGFIAGKGVVLEKIGTASIYANKPFSKARLVYNEENCYLELYNSQALTNVECLITIHTLKNKMCDYTALNLIGSIPDGYSSLTIDI